MSSDVLDGINRARLRSELHRLTGVPKSLEYFCDLWVPCAAPPGVDVRLFPDSGPPAYCGAFAFCVPHRDSRPPLEPAELEGWLAWLISPGRGFATDHGDHFRVADGCPGGVATRGCRLCLRVRASALQAMGAELPGDREALVALVLIELDASYPISPPVAKCVYFVVERSAAWYSSVSTLASALAPLRPPEALTALDPISTTERFLGESWSAGISLGNLCGRILAVLASQVTAHGQADLLVSPAGSPAVNPLESRLLKLPSEAGLPACLSAVFLLQLLAAILDGGLPQAPQNLALFWGLGLPAAYLWWLRGPAWAVGEEQSGSFRQVREARVLLLLLALGAPAINFARGSVWWCVGLAALLLAARNFGLVAACVVAASLRWSFVLFPAVLSFALGQQLVRVRPVGVLSQRVELASKSLWRLWSRAGGALAAVTVSSLLTVLPRLLPALTQQPQQDCGGEQGLWVIARTLLPLSREGSEGLVWRMLRPLVAIDDAPADGLVVLLLSTCLALPPCVAVAWRPSLRRLQYALVCTGAVFLLFSLDVTEADLAAFVTVLNSLMAVHLDLVVLGNLAVSAALGVYFPRHGRSLALPTLAWTMLAKTAERSFEQAFGPASVRNLAVPIWSELAEVADAIPVRLLAPHTLGRPRDAHSCLFVLNKAAYPLTLLGCGLLCLQPGHGFLSHAQSAFACVCLGLVAFTALLAVTSRRTAADAALPLQAKVLFSAPFV